MSKFKVGDKVQFILFRDAWGVEHCRIGTIVAILSSGYTVLYGKRSFARTIVNQVPAPPTKEVTWDE